MSAKSFLLTVGLAVLLGVAAGVLVNAVISIPLAAMIVATLVAAALGIGLSGAVRAKRPLVPAADQASLTEERAEEEQQDDGLQEAALATVIKALPIPAVLIDPSRIIVAINQPATTLLNRDGGDRPLPTLIRHPAFLEAVRKASEIGETIETTFAEAVPAVRQLQALIAPVSAAEWSGAGALILLRDLTMHVKTEKMRADFIANVSHELRTPLASLKGFVETLRGPAASDPAAQREFLRIMDEQTGRMTRLVDTLMSLSKIEADQGLPPTGAVDINQTVSGVAEALHLVAAKQSIVIEVKQEAHPAIITGDEDQIARVARNLIENAIKYGKAPSTIAVRTYNVAETDRGPRSDPALHADQASKGTADMVAFAVSDSGEGIPEEHIPRLTERFYRVDVARARGGVQGSGAPAGRETDASVQLDSGGAGLGLAIVKHIVARHGGRIEIASEMGKGSTFAVLFPQRDAAV